MDDLLDIFNRLSASQRSLVSAAVGFLFYGSWAFWVNHQHGIGMGIRAGCVQGSYSFLLTLIMTGLIETLFSICGRLFSNRNLVIWATISCSCFLIFSTSWSINVLAGTPEVLRTVILGYIVGGIFCTTYVYGLARFQTN